MSQKEGKNVSNLSHDKVSELFIVKNVIIIPSTRAILQNRTRPHRI